VGGSYGALAFNGSVLYGDNLVAPGGSTHLVTFDPPTGAVTDIGASVTHLDAIAFEPVTVPEPGTLSLLLGAGAMALLANARRK